MTTKPGSSSTPSLKTFYLLVITQTLSAIGSGMTNLAIGIWVFQQTGNTTPLMLVGFFFWLPRMFVGSFGGVLADRLNRKYLIMLGDAGQAIPTFLLMISFATGNFALWQLYATALVQALFDLLQSPAISASITMLVPDAQRPRANALLEVMGPVSGFLAPSLAGIVYSVVNVEGVLLVDLATFLVAVAVIARVHIPQPPASEESAASKGSVWQEVRGGWRFLRSRRGLFYLSLYFLFLNFITNGVWRLMAPYLLTLTDDNETTVGVLLSLASLGLVTGGLVTMIWHGTRTRIHTILPALAMAGFGLMVLGVVRVPILIGITLFLMQTPYKMTNALLSSIQQKKIPPDMQGRVYALLGQISTFALPITYLITGPLVDKVLEPAVGKAGWDVVAPLVGSEEGVGMALYIMGCGFLLFCASLITYSLPVVRHLERNLPNYEM